MKKQWRGVTDARELRETYLKPAAALYETVPRTSRQAFAQALTPSTLYMAAIALPKDLPIRKITTVFTVAANTPTHWWFGLFDSGGVMLARTDDFLTAALNAARQTKSLTTGAAGAITSYSTTYEGLHYLGFMVAGTSGGSVAGDSSTTGINGDPPILFGSADTGLTTPPAFPFTAAALTGVSFVQWAYVGA